LSQTGCHPAVFVPKIAPRLYSAFIGRGPTAGHPPNPSICSLYRQAASTLSSSAFPSRKQPIIFKKPQFSKAADFQESPGASSLASPHPFPIRIPPFKNINST